jgi:hypothetical protein
MMQSWMSERMTEEHQRDLAMLIRAENRSSNNREDVAPSASTLLAQRRSTARHGVAHRPIGRQIGALLIRAGTRLGGTSISPS